MKRGYWFLAIAIVCFLLAWAIATNTTTWQPALSLHGAAGIFSLVVSVVYIYWYYRFQKAFGVSSPSNAEDWKIRNAQTNLINTELRKKAKWLEREIILENNLMKTAPDTSTELKSHIRALELAARMVAVRKKQFWQARNSAKFFGFGVNNSYKDYLSNF